MTDCAAQRVVFAGTPEFAKVALAGLISSEHEVVAVLTQPDRPAGRGRKLVQSPVKQLALEHGIDVLQPESFKEPGSVAAVADLQADVMVVAAYGLILPDALLELPKFGCLNIHASLLPRWRGAAPIHRAIAAGDSETGICIMQMDSGLDTGDVLHVDKIPIVSDSTTAGLHDELAALGAHALLHSLPKRCAGTLVPVPQAIDGVSYAHKIKKSEAKLDFQNDSAEILDRKIRAFNPWPVAETFIQGERVRIWRSTFNSDRTSTAAAGTVIAIDEQGVHVSTVDGVLTLLEMQRAGKRPMSATDVSRGLALEGVVL